MFFYVFPYLVVFISAFYFFTIKAYERIRAVDVFLVLCPALLVAVLRGNIGVDTATYSRYFTNKINHLSDDNTFEIGFEMLINFLVLLNLKNTGIFGFIALITTFFLSISFSGSRSSALLLLLVFFPIFYVDSTMNALRYGLSFSISSLAIDLLYKRKFLGFFLGMIVAVSIQISASVIIAFFLIARVNWKILLILSVLILLFSSEISDSILPYLIDKKEAYAVSYSPSRLSGVLPLSVFCILYILYISFTEKAYTIREIHIFLILEVFSFVLAKYSYAGLRFQMLFLFCLIVSIKNNFPAYRSKIMFFKTLFIFSLLLFGFFLRTIVTAESDLDSKYLPFEFFWTRG